MSATPKQTRAVMKRIYLHTRLLQRALNDAHGIGVIQYPNDKYNEEGPCSAMSEVRERIDLTTRKSLAEAMKVEIKNTIKR